MCIFCLRLIRLGGFKVLFPFNPQLLCLNCNMEILWIGFY